MPTILIHKYKQNERKREKQCCMGCSLFCNVIKFFPPNKLIIPKYVFFRLFQSIVSKVKSSCMKRKENYDVYSSLKDYYYFKKMYNSLTKSDLYHF